MSLAAGQAFGNYRILSRVGVGGMGLVYLAEHPQIGKKVALKVIHRELAGNKEVVSRFLNEARAVNQIGNEHIVEIHDFGQTDDGEHFFIMEYIQGRTLAADMAKQPLGLAISRGLHIGAQIASALGAAHDNNIIHRDLKPDNVMLIERLGDPDFVKLLDFGLAKFLTDSDARQLTAAGVVLGTPQYMSPEACESRKGIDHRSDIYSLGILLFQMLTGQLPFDGESMGEVLVKQVAHAPPAPRGLNENIPPAVEQVVLRCLAKDPGSRFQRMRELRDALLDPSHYLASSPPVVPVAGAEARTMYGIAAARKTAAANAVAPPAPSAQRGAEIPNVAEGRTMIAGAGTAQDGSSAPPPVAGSNGAGGGNATAYMDDASHRMFAGHMERNEPKPVENKTMMIGTPPGYKDHPPRNWPTVMLLLVLVVGGGVSAIVYFTSDSKSSEGAAAASASALMDSGLPSSSDASASAVADAGPTVAATTDAGAPPVLSGTARIKLTTVPTGAEVYDAHDNLLGTTPVTLEMPKDGVEAILRFKHPQAEPGEKRFIPTQDAAFEVELAAKVKSRGKGSGSGKRGGKKGKKGGDNLLRPTF